MFCLFTNSRLIPWLLASMESSMWFWCLLHAEGFFLFTSSPSTASAHWISPSKLSLATFFRGGCMGAGKEISSSVWSKSSWGTVRELVTHRVGWIVKGCQPLYYEMMPHTTCSLSSKSWICPLLMSKDRCNSLWGCLSFIASTMYIQIYGFMQQSCQYLPKMACSNIS